jgi:uncharacterized peroxidase-related enzyme
MQTIQPIEINEAAGSTRRLLDTVTNHRGAVPHMLQAMAQSPQTLEGYLYFRRALAGGKLTSTMREQIALAVAQANHCDYSVAQHASVARRLGLTIEEIAASREGRASDRGIQLALQFARDLTIRGAASSVLELRDAGYDDAEVVELLAHVALNLFENYFNIAARTEIDSADESAAVIAA